MNTGKTYKTRQRAEIEGVLRDGDCMTVRDICARLASSGANVGETTVYRTLEKNGGGGRRAPLRPGKGAAVYRLADDRRCDGCTPSLPAARWSIWTAALSAGWRRTSKRNTASRWTADERCCTAPAAAAERSGRNETFFRFCLRCFCLRCRWPPALRSRRKLRTACRLSRPTSRCTTSRAALRGGRPRCGCFCPGRRAARLRASPSDMKAILGCDLFLYIGGESDAWVETSALRRTFSPSG